MPCQQKEYINSNLEVAYLERDPLPLKQPVQSFKIFGPETSANLRGEIQIQNTDIHLRMTASPLWTCRAARTFIELILHGHWSLISVLFFSVCLL